MKTSTVVRHTLTHLFIIVLGLFMIYPIVWMIVSSFKPNNMIFSDPGLIPKAVTIENYITGWKGYAGTSFGRFFANSLFMCAAAIVGNLIACTMAAYAFARLKFAGRDFWFAVMMVTLMLPGSRHDRAALYPVQHLRVGGFVPPDNRAEIPRDGRLLRVSARAVHPQSAERARRGGDYRRVRESRGFSFVSSSRSRLPLW